MASMVVTWWKVAYLPSVTYHSEMCDHCIFTESHLHGHNNLCALFPAGLNKTIDVLTQFGYLKLC